MLINVVGALGLIWSILWAFLTYDSPAQHPRIDPAERDYIEQSQGLLGAKKVLIVIMNTFFFL